MANEDIVQHSFRLNLNNPRDLKLHQAIMSASMEIYKSKNNYIRKAAYKGRYLKSFETHPLLNKRITIKIKHSMLSALYCVK